jgi:hypothetical protein
MAEEKLPHLVDWLTIVSLIGLFLIAFFKVRYARRFYAFLRIPLNASYFTEINQEKEHPFWFVVFTESILVLGISQFIFLLVSMDKAQNMAFDFWLFLRILLIGMLFITLQRFIHSLTGYLFEVKKVFTQFMHIKDGHLQWAALLLIAINVFIIYSPIRPQAMAYAGLVLLAAAYILGVVRAALIVGNKTLNPLQLFLYLCALEILPVFVLIKWLS